MLDQTPQGPGGRFIDFAHHGGCSQKLAPSRLRTLLHPLISGWSDAGLARVGDQVTASSVDVVLPMIDDSALFGRIVTNHVLSDLYAVGVEPTFALNILGMPDGVLGAEGLPVEEIDRQVQEMLISADEALREAGAVSVGGHTLAVDVLFFGMAATGIARDARTVGLHTALPGDRIVLTKPLGTSVTTKAWKMGATKLDDADDVLAGMLRSNRAASEAMLGLERCACTDVSGFGLLGHLRNILEASSVSATIHLAELPIYPSAQACVAEDSPTRIFHSNKADIESHLVTATPLLPGLELFLLDAQVSGGLLLAMPAEDVERYCEALHARGEQAWEIGEIDDRAGALITLQ